MAKTRELSQHSHTRLQHPKDWPDDWPRLGDVISFWHSLKPIREIAGIAGKWVDEAVFREFAIRFKLLDESGDVPQWLTYIGTSTKKNPDFVAAALLGRSFKLELPLGDLSAYNPQPQSMAKRAQWNSERPSTTLPRLRAGSTTLGKLIREVESLRRASRPTRVPTKMRLELEKRSLEALLAFQNELYLEIDREPMGKAKLRIQKAIAPWVEIQYTLCELEAASGKVPRTDHGLAQADVDLFVRFQCRGESVKELGGPSRDIDRESVYSKTWKTLGRVSARLGIPLRPSRRGRPSRKSGNLQ